MICLTGRFINTKMSLSNLRQGIVIEILCFLAPKEIVLCERVCKNFRETLQKSPIQFVKHFKSCFGVDFLPENISFNELKDLGRQITQNPEIRLNVLAFYSNGRAWSNRDYFSIHNLFTHTPREMYCTEGSSENVLVKGMFSQEFDISNCRSGSKYISQNELYLEEDLNRLKEFREKTKYDTVVSSVALNPVFSGYTCPVHRLMVFIGNEEFPDIDFIQKFHFCKRIENVVEAADSLGLSFELNTTNWCHLVLFKQNMNYSTKPLFWADIEKIPRVNSDLPFKLADQFVGSYVYVLLIDAFKGERNPNRLNIDASNIHLKGSHILYN